MRSHYTRALSFFFFFNDTATTEIYTLSLHDALPISLPGDAGDDDLGDVLVYVIPAVGIALAAAGIAFAVVRWRGTRGPQDRGGDGLAEAERRLDADMERYEL